MLKQQQSGPSGRKTSNGTSGPSSMSSTASGLNTSNSRAANGRSRNSVKMPHQSSPVFEGVYNNARMLHFLTAVVGSTCDIRVKNGSVYEGIFKTLSSRCELAVDAVHRRCEEGGNSSAPPRREEITDTMIFSTSDLVTMTCRDVDLNYATRDTFTDTAISSARVNGEHKEKVLQRWEGGDINGESYDLEADASNGWDANEMFRFNEENYGIKSTYDSSLSMYTVPLERGSSEGFRQREARAARLASEIESSPQYRHRVSLENEDGKTEEEKFSAVVRDRDGGERERGRESPRERERERGRDSPSFTSSGSRESKYIPLHQRAREMVVSGSSMRGERERGERGGGGGGATSLPNRMGGYHSSRPGPPNSSPRPPLPSSASQPPPSSDRNSPLSSRGGYSPHHPQSSPGPAGAYTPPAALGGGGGSSRLSEPPAASPAPALAPPTSPPTPHSHSLPLPHSLSDPARPVNGVSSRTSPKSQRPVQTNRPLRTANSHTTPAVSRSPKSGVASQDPTVVAAPYLDTTSVSMATQKPTGPAPLFPVDVNEILSSAGKERTAESPVSPQDSKSVKAPSVQQRSQIEELRKFGKEFRLQPTGGGSSGGPTASSAPADAPQPSPAQPSPAEPALPSEPKQSPAQNPSQPHGPSSSPAEEQGKEKEAEGAVAGGSAAPSVPSAALDAQPPGTPQPPRTPGAEEPRLEPADRGDGVTDQVKKSTLNPNAKEFNPNKLPLTLSKPTSAPTPPRPTPPSPSVVLQPPPGQAPIYNAPYLSYVSQIHSVQAPQMYQYTMSTVSQGKYPRAKGSVVAPRSDHSSSAPPMIQAAASAAGPPLVASPYPQSYLQYSPQQYSQQVIQAMTHYPGQPMYSMLQGGARMLGSGGGHPQQLGPPGGPQFPGQGDGPPGAQQGLYAPQSFSHHSGSMHPPQPSSTPTGNQPPPQHAAPSPSQSAQSGPQPQSLFHSGPLSAPTPPNMPPGHSSPQGSYPIQGYSLHGHQHIPSAYSSLGQLAQAHVPGTLSGPHHSGTHGHPQVMLLHAPPPQQGPGSGPQHPQHGPPPQQGAHQHYAYIGHPQVQVQAHPPQQLPFHPQGN
ncbi:ataxin-2-like protein isoform X1 [Anguilla anguilla]|uniref:ataxin-2-like protein isoform X1 n=1 Tax=Anguilla anguilla TaxID=7936 RepID=UPI0015B2B98F|nr:ataxin-2-like protein isoform X1 [Anguilla anguilla]